MVRSHGYAGSSPAFSTRGVVKLYNTWHGARNCRYRILSPHKFVSGVQSIKCALDQANWIPTYKHGRLARVVNGAGLQNQRETCRQFKSDTVLYMAQLANGRAGRLKPYSKHKKRLWVRIPPELQISSGWRTVERAGLNPVANVRHECGFESHPED